MRSDVEHSLLTAACGPGVEHAALMPLDMRVGHAAPQDRQRCTVVIEAIHSQDGVRSELR